MCRRRSKSVSILTVLIFLLVQVMTVSPAMAVVFSLASNDQTTATFSWTLDPNETGPLNVQQSIDGGNSWTASSIDPQTPLSGPAGTVKVTGLLPGTGYKFKLSVTDQVYGTADSEIVNVTTSGAAQTASGELSVYCENAISGETGSIMLEYCANESETFENGTVVFTLPSGFAASSTDTYQIYDQYGTAGTGSVGTAGQVVAITGISGNSINVVLNLNNKIIPAAGSYTFSARADADGTGPARTASPGNGYEEAILTVYPPDDPSRTMEGYLSVNPEMGAAGQTANITLEYMPGDVLTGGAVVFKLPQGFTASAGTDTWRAGEGQDNPLAPGQISTAGGYTTVTISPVDFVGEEVFILSLKNKVLPGEGDYIFSAFADTDGDGPLAPSSGSGAEEAFFTVFLPNALRISPSGGAPGSVAEHIELTYTLGQEFTGGSAVFELPDGFTANTGDDFIMDFLELYCPLGSGPSSISGGGRTVTISSIQARAGETVTINLYNKTLPQQPGVYIFSVSADPDGTGPLTASTASQSFTVGSGAGGGGGGYLPPAGVSAHNVNPGQSSGYQFQVPITRQLNTGDKIVITFPEAYRDRLNSVSLTRSTPDPHDPYAFYAPCNADINGYNSGTVTISSVSGSGVGVTVTISGTTGEYDYLTFDLSGIVNPAAGDYQIQIRTVRGELTLETISDPYPVEIRQAGNYTLTVALKNENGTPISAAGARIGITGMGLPPVFENTNASGVCTFGSLSTGSYSIWAEVSPAGYIPTGPPLSVWVDENQAVDIVLRQTMESSGVKRVTVRVTGLPPGERARIYASSSADYASRQVTGTGSPVSEDFYLQRGVTYYLGVDPVITDWRTEQPGFVPPATYPLYVPRVQEEALFPIPDNTVSITLASSSSNIDVSLRDQDGNPVPNASVYAYSPLTRGAGGSGYTDAGGNCRIRVPAGSYIVGVVAAGFPGMPEQPVSVLPAETRNLTFRAISPGLTISGKVLDAGGGGIPRASVWANSTNGRDHSEATADSNGNYTLRVKDGAWKVGAFAAGYGQIPEITVNMGGVNKTGQNLQVPPQHITVAGLVRVGGSPVPNAQVWAVESLNRGGNSTFTDSSGRYSMKLNTGAGQSYTVYCWIPGYGEKSQGGITASRSDLHFDADPAYLKVIFSNDGSQKFSGYVAAYNGQSRSGQDFSDVSYVVLKVTPGGQAYSVEAQIIGVGRKTLANIPVSVSNTEASPATADFSGSLAQMANYTVTVRDSGGNGLNDAFVSVFAQDGNIAGNGLTSASGQISFNIPSGSLIKYSVKKDGYVPVVSDPVTVSAANGSAAVSLQSSQNLVVTGSVTAPGNISSVFVWAAGADGGWVGGSFANDADDQSVAYAVYLPRAGSWVLSARADGYEIDGTESSRTVGGPATLNLTLKSIPGYSAGIKKESVGASGGAVDNREVGVKLIIPTGSLGLSQGESASITTRNTTSIPETGTARTVGSASEINATDSSGKPITTLKNKIEITLDYSPYASMLTPGQIDALQLAYWDSIAKDWVVIPSVNDKINKKLVGYTDHLTKFAAVYPESLVLRGMQTAPAPPAASNSPSTGGASSSATGMVSEEALKIAIDTAVTTGRITLQAPDKILTLTPGQILKIEASAKPVEIKISGVTLRFEAAVLKSLGLDLNNVVSVFLGARRLDPEDAGKLAARAANGDLYSLAGDVYEFAAGAVMDNNRQQSVKVFGGTIIMALPVPDQFREAAAEGRLAACRFNDAAGAWEEIPGKYDSAGGIYLVGTDRFSYWALMEKKELKTFSDIIGHWARKDIEYMAARGYVSGMGGGLFAPDAAVTRAQFATMLVNALRLEGAPDAPFTDVGPGQWFYTSVGRAYAAGLVRGTSPGMFAPEDLITREQMAAMICNALNFKGLLAEVAGVEDVLGGFADRQSVSGWARKSAAQAVSHGILRGKPMGGGLIFAPGDRATRAEAAVMLKNFIGQMR